jgi:hypothetical protein
VSRLDHTVDESRRQGRKLGFLVLIAQGVSFLSRNRSTVLQ